MSIVCVGIGQTYILSSPLPIPVRSAVVCTCWLWRIRNDNNSENQSQLTAPGDNVADRNLTT